jgi:hypothetical protein
MSTFFAKIMRRYLIRVPGLKADAIDRKGRTQAARLTPVRLRRQTGQQISTIMKLLMVP